MVFCRTPAERTVEGVAAARRLEEAAKAAGVPYSIGWFGAMLTLFFSEEPVVDWETAARCSTDRFARFFRAMIDRGVYLPCSQYEAMFVSAAHTEADIDATIAAAGEAMGEG